jgi:hypothetical protein
LARLANNEFVWGLSILAKMIKFGSQVSWRYKTQIETLIECIGPRYSLAKPNRTSLDKQVVKCGYKLLRCFIKSLSVTYITEYRSLPDYQWTALETASIEQAKQLCGQAGDLSRLDISWHMPTEEELQYIISITNRFGSQLFQAVEEFIVYYQQLLSTQTGVEQHLTLPMSTRTLIRQWIKLLGMLFQCSGEWCLYSCNKFPTVTTEADNAYMSQYGRLYSAGNEMLVHSSNISDETLAQLRVTRDSMAESLHQLCTTLLQDGSSCDDTKTLSELMKTLTKIFLPPYGGQ